jgi:outer membrane protein assembly factor BamB
LFNQYVPAKKIQQYIQKSLCLLLLLLFSATEANAGLFGGTVKSVNPKTKTIVVQSRSKSKAFKLTPTTKVYVDGKEAELSDIGAGSRVSVSTKRNGKVIKVSAKGGENSAKPITVKTPGKKTIRSKKSPVKKVMKKTTPNQKKKPRSLMVNGWTGFRGQLRDNISTETGLLKEWPEEGPELLWKSTGLGEGYSSVSIAEGTLYTMGNLDGKELIFALNLEDGEEIWTIPTGGKVFEESRGNGPRCTPTIDDYRVYGLGGNGDLICIDSISGNSLWSKNILDEFSAENIKWGISESVLIDGEKLICTPGGKKGTIVALNKITGEVIWIGNVPGNPAAGYASPIRIEVDGFAQYVSFTSKGVVSVSAEDGKFLWKDDSSANKVANCSTPLYENGQLFYASGYGTGATLLDLNSSGKKVKSKVRYQTKDMKNHHGGMILLDGYVYGSNDPGILTCMDFKTGDVIWKNRSVGKGSLAYADGMLYLRSEKGPIALIEATSEGYKEKGKFDQPSRSGKPSWPHPVVFDGKLFIRDMDTLLCYQVKAK